MVKKKEKEMQEESDEYEVVPLTPLRRLEKRLEAIEGSKGTTNVEKFADRIIEMVELNQRIVEETIKANVGLREDLSVLIGKLDVLQTKITEFIDVIKSAGEEEGEAATMEKTVTPVLEKINEMNKKVIESNTAMVETLSNIDRRLKRIQLGGGARTTAQATSILTRRKPIEREKIAIGGEV